MTNAEAALFYAQELSFVDRHQERLRASQRGPVENVRRSLAAGKRTRWEDAQVLVAAAAEMRRLGIGLET